MKKFLFIFIVIIALGGWTKVNLKDLPNTLSVTSNPLDKLAFLDRHGEKLSITYKTAWNVSRQVPLSKMPKFLKDVFIFVEDGRFYNHHGVDWIARLNAIYQGLKSGHIYRGASTISEQVVKLLHPRPRNYVTKWLEGFEAYNLESKFSKDQILEFYLNQVPYARNVRGVESAALFYFDRKLSVLSKREIIALAVMLRSPSKLDPKINITNLEKVVNRTAYSLKKHDLISEFELKEILSERLVLKEHQLETDASHFIQYLKDNPNIRNYAYDGVVLTTIDSELQKSVGRALDVGIKNLREKNVNNGAALVVDLRDNSVLAYVTGNMAKETEQIDAVQILRQPGSTLKPFLYAKALELGYTASSVIDDAPLVGGVGDAVHRYRNFSDTYYGPLRLREALANSLNTPAIRTINYVTYPKFFNVLKSLGFNSLKEDPDHYGAGLVLGNGEVTLYELARAYAVLARGGIYRDFNLVMGADEANENRVFSAEDTDIISDILADPEARALEFGRSPLFEFSQKVAFKTGTSSNFRDAWVVGFTQDYLVAVWMGNYNRTSMDRVTGSLGPVSVMQVIFGELRLRRGIRENINLVHRMICPITGKLAGENCPRKDEVFKKDNVVSDVCDGDHKIKQRLYDDLEIVYPINNMTFALSKDIPREKQAINLEIKPLKNPKLIHWWLDGKEIGQSNKQNGAMSWKITLGKHKLQAVSGTEYSREVEFKVVNSSV